MEDTLYDSATRAGRVSRSEGLVIAHEGEISSEVSRTHNLASILRDEIAMLRDSIAPILLPFPKELNDPSKNSGRSTDLGNGIFSANEALERCIGDIASIRNAVAL